MSNALTVSDNHESILLAHELIIYQPLLSSLETSDRGQIIHGHHVVVDLSNEPRLILKFHKIRFL